VKAPAVFSAGVGGFSPASTPPIAVSISLQSGQFFFCPCQVRRSAGSACFEARQIAPAAQIERPTAVRTVFAGPKG